MTAVSGPAETFRLLPSDRAPREMEEEMLALWEREQIFTRTLSEREGAPEYVFFEGPPTANGRPGIHHVFARTIKDLFCRHRVMRGFHVTRKAGWDTHGLPVEIEVEKALGLSGKPDIERIGVEKFNQLCRESVWKYKGEWEALSARIGYWLDYANPYVTYSNEYVESVWWALATMHEKDLLYRGHKILPYCPRCGTTLSSHEVAQGYQDVIDPSVYIALDLEGERGDGRRRIIVWTTTPWTLVSNVALAVHPDLAYLELRKKTVSDWTIVLAEARAAAVLGDDWTDRWDVVKTMKGSELAGTRYRRPLDWVPFKDGAHEIIVAETFVSAEDGSGVVHMAPAFGADDYAAGQRHGLAFLQPVSTRGEFPEDMPLVGGKFVKAADPIIIEELKRRDVLWKAGTMEHSYPHCWRCGTPLLYYARESWFVRTTAFKDRMLARNARVNWNPPEVGEGRFGEWLKNNIDWAVSRDRYWGSPLPIWLCDKDDTHEQAVGSYDRLAELSGTPLPADFDPHKPFIDAYTFPCTRGNCGGRMSRVPQVIDAWFDSGSMPFAQWHYPFENKDITARHYPADFIAEGVDQTRGWFYSLLAIATALGDALPNNHLAHEGIEGAVDTAPYRAVVVNDLVLDANGVKMSKRLGNIVDPMQVVSAHGADAVRLFLLTSSQVWLPRRFDENMIRETAGRFLLTLKNTYTGIFAQYANFGWSPSHLDPAPADRPVIDRWILSRLAAVEKEADDLLGAYDAHSAAKLVMSFVDEDVSKWYVRQTRNRFYDVDAADNRAAFATLHEVLTVVCRLLAPFCPFVSDFMHRELTGQSVHLAPYRRAEHAPRDLGLEESMEQLRRLATLGRNAREEAGIKVRQPLSRLVCVVPKSAGPSLEALVPLLKAELNVKQVEFASSADALVTLEAKANFRSLGKRFGSNTKLAAQAVEALSSDALRRFEHGEPLAVSIGNESHQLTPEDITIRRRASGDFVVAEGDGFFAALDPVVTPALRREGIARELVSRIQRMRKDAGFEVSDRITVQIAGDGEVAEAVREFQDWMAGEVLARTVALGAAITGKHHATQAVDLDGLSAQVAIDKES